MSLWLSAPGHLWSTWLVLMVPVVVAVGWLSYRHGGRR